MVSIQEQIAQAETQVAQTEAVIEERKKATSQARASAQQIKAQPLTIKRQLQLQASGEFETFQRQGGLAGEKARKIQQKRQVLQAASREEAITQKAQKQVKETKGQIAGARAALAEQARQEAALKQARKLFSKGARGSLLVTQESKLVRKFFNELSSEREAALEAKIRAQTRVNISEEGLETIKVKAKTDPEFKKLLEDINKKTVTTFSFKPAGRIANLGQLLPQVADRPSIANVLRAQGVALPTDQKELETIAEQAKFAQEVRQIRETPVFKATSAFLEPAFETGRKIKKLGSDFAESATTQAEIGRQRILATDLGAGLQDVKASPTQERFGTFLTSVPKPGETITEVSTFFGDKPFSAIRQDPKGALKQLGELSTVPTEFILSRPGRAKEEIVSSAREFRRAEIFGKRSGVRTAVGFAVEGAAQLIPETPVGIAATAAGVKAFTFLSPAGKTLFAVAPAPSGASVALSPGLDVPVEQRFAGGLIAGLGVVGAGAEVSPFVRGAFARGGKLNILGETTFDITRKGLFATKRTGQGFRQRIPKSEETITIVPPGGQPKFVFESATPKLKGDVKKIAAEFKESIPRRKEPKLPGLDKEKSQIIDILRREEGVSVSGSLAQEILVRGKTGKVSRKGVFESDIDILASDPKRIAKLIGEKVSGVEVKKTRITDSGVGKEFDIFRVSRKGEVIADVDPIGFAEEGFALRGKKQSFEGLSLIDPEVRLLAKLSQVARGKTKRGKVVEDVSTLTGGDLQLGAGVTGAFQKSFASQAAFAGTEIQFGSGARSFFKRFSDPTVKIGKDSTGLGFFATPSKVGEPFLIRESRLNLVDFFKRPKIDPRTTVQFRLTREQPQAVIGKAKVTTGKVISPSALKKLAARADKGDAKAIAELRKVTKKFKDIEGEFTPLGQFSGELEVALRGSLTKIRRRGAIRRKGQAIEVIEARPTKLSDLSKRTIRLLERDKKGGLSQRQQEKLLSRLERETGVFDQSRFDNTVFVSSPGVTAATSRRQPKGDRRFDITRTTRAPRIFRREARPTRAIRTPRPNIRISRVDRPQRIARGISPLRSLRTTRRIERPDRTDRIIKTPRTTRIVERPERTKTPNLILGKTPTRKTETGFITLEKRFGTFRKITGRAVTKRQAIELGARRTSRTLGRTFKIVETRQRVASQQGVRRALPLKQFRRFRIQEGRKRNLRNIFIQKAKASLGSVQEVAEIQRARKKKGSRKGIDRKTLGL